MKDISAALYRRKCRILMALFVLAITAGLLGSGQLVLAGENGDVNSSQKAEQELTKYLKDKYVHIREVKSTIRKTPNGPKGKLHISGEFTPKAAIKGKDRKERSRAIAKAFIAGEPSLFGITNPEELREYKVISSSLGITVKYHRYIGDVPLENVEIFVTVSPDEKISSISAHVNPPDPALYRALSRKTITEEKAFDIVSRDLAADGINPDNLFVLSIRKTAIQSPPHVVWVVDVNLEKGGVGRWIYKINAYSGEIVEKRFALQSGNVLNPE